LMAFTRVGALAELWGGEMLSRDVGGRRGLLVRTHDGVLAYEDRCAHLGVPLSEGCLDGEILTCGAHHWQYDLRKGRGVNPASARLTRFAVSIEGDDVLVDVERAGD